MVQVEAVQITDTCCRISCLQVQQRPLVNPVHIIDTRIVVPASNSRPAAAGIHSLILAMANFGTLVMDSVASSPRCFLSNVMHHLPHRVRIRVAAHRQFLTREAKGPVVCLIHHLHITVAQILQRRSCRLAVPLPAMVSVLGILLMQPEATICEFLKL